MRIESIHCSGPDRHAFDGDPFDPGMQGRQPKVCPECGGSWLMVTTATAAGGESIDPSVLFEDSPFMIKAPPGVTLELVEMVGHAAPGTWRRRRRSGKAAREFLRYTSVLDPSHMLGGRVARVLRLLDRRGDHYNERVFDPDSRRLLHELHEPLSEHQNRGSAKPRDEEP